MRTPAEIGISVIGWGVFLAFIAIFIAAEDDSSSGHLQQIAAIGIPVWITTCFAYIFTLRSNKSLIILCRNLVGVAILFAGYALISAGNPSYDDDGFVVDEGYNASFENRCTAAVLTFMKVMGGGVIGIVASDYMKRRSLLSPRSDS